MRMFVCVRGAVVCEYLSVQRNVIRRMFVQGHGIMRIFVQGSVVMRIFICTRVCSNANICTGECSNANIRARECSNAKNFAAHMRVCYVRGNSLAVLFSFCLNTLWFDACLFISVVMILAFLFGDYHMYMSSYCMLFNDAAHCLGYVALVAVVEWYQRGKQTVRKNCWVTFVHHWPRMDLPGIESCPPL
jgi:hypothetical protein